MLHRAQKLGAFDVDQEDAEEQQLQRTVAERLKSAVFLFTLQNAAGSVLRLKVQESSRHQRHGIPGRDHWGPTRWMLEAAVQRSGAQRVDQESLVARL